MIEERRLTEKELNQLIKEAPETETKNLLRILSGQDMTPYDFFSQQAIEHFGLINDNPIYAGILTDKKEIWTIANKNIKAQKSLYKYSKRKVKDLANKYGRVYATMEKGMTKNRKWTERIGFKRCSENEHTITYYLQGG